MQDGAGVGRKLVTNNILHVYQVTSGVIAMTFASICLNCGGCFTKSFCARRDYLKIVPEALSPGRSQLLAMMIRKGADMLRHWLPSG